MDDTQQDMVRVRRAGDTLRRVAAPPRRSSARIEKLVFLNEPDGSASDGHDDRRVERGFAGETHSEFQDHPATLKDEEPDKDCGDDDFGGTVVIDEDDHDLTDGENEVDDGIEARSPFFYALNKLQTAVGQGAGEHGLSAKLDDVAQALKLQVKASEQMLDRVNQAGARIAEQLKRQADSAETWETSSKAIAFEIVERLREQSEASTKMVGAMAQLGTQVRTTVTTLQRGADDPARIAAAILTIAIGPKGGPSQSAEGAWFRRARYDNLSAIAAEQDETRFIERMTAAATGQTSRLIAKADEAVLIEILQAARVAVDAVQEVRLSSSQPANSGVRDASSPAAQQTPTGPGYLPEGTTDNDDEEQAS